MSKFYYLASTLTNINDILKVDFCYLANILINTNDILKIHFYYLASTLTNTNDKADNIIIEILVVSNQLFFLYH